jgi:phosphatidylserine/phosphatidylglycerophosphate/cardiolipin synthase-like enzyme
VVGDSSGNVFALSTADGSVVGSPLPLPYGTLAGGCAVRGTTAFFGEGATQGTTLMHALDVTSGSDAWETAGPQLSGSVDGPPALRGATLYVGLSTGFLQPIDISSPASPRAGTALDVMNLPAGTSAAVTGLLPAPDGRQLILVTARGLYGVSLGPPPQVRWSAQTSSSFTGTPAVLAGWVLCAATGAEVVGYDVSTLPGSSGQLSPLWTFTAGANVTSLQRISRDFVLAHDASGEFTLLLTRGTSTDVVRRTFRSAATGAANAIGPLAGELLTVVGDSGLVANRVLTTVDLHIEACPAWQASGFGSHVAPVVTDGIVFVLSDDAQLRAFNAGNGKPLWSTPVTGAHAPFGPTTVLPYAWPAKQAAVQFLNDSEYFYKLRDLLAATAAGGVSGVTLPPPSQRTFQSMAGAVGAAGWLAYVIMWDQTPLMTALEATSGQLTSPLTALLHNKPVAFVRQWLSRWFQVGVSENSRSAYALKKLPGVQAFLEPYDRVWLEWYDSAVELSSNHQKIAVFSIAGVKFALVGGFNLVTPQYFDDPSHPMTSTDSMGNPNFHSWHDTAVLLQGEAAALVEAEFDRRWAKGGGSSSAGLPATYAKVAAWQLRHTSCLDAQAVCDTGVATPQPYADPTLQTPEVPVEILVTNDEKGLTPTAAVCDRLVELVYAARSYIYLENFTFHSIDLVRALVDRLSETAGPLVILVLTHPTGDPEPIQSAQNLLTRMAVIALEIAADGWDTLVTLDGERVPASASPVLVLDERGVELSTLTWTRPDSLTGQVLLGSIAQVVRSQTSARLFVGAPARYIADPSPSDAKYQLPGWAANFRAVYVHSKLALFDDRVAVVGSANLSRRSMRQDGELAACINDAATAVAIRSTLFTHWGMTTVANWGADMAEFARTTTPRIGVLPLDVAVFNAERPHWLVQAIFGVADPSIVL